MRYEKIKAEVCLDWQVPPSTSAKTHDAVSYLEVAELYNVVVRVSLFVTRRGNPGSWNANAYFHRNATLIYSYCLRDNALN